MLSGTHKAIKQCFGGVEYETSEASYTSAAAA